MRGDVPISASTIDHWADLVNADNKLEPSRSRILKAMNANTNGMHAIHAARRNLTGLTRCNPNSIIEPFNPLLLWCGIHIVLSSDLVKRLKGATFTL